MAQNDRLFGLVEQYYKHLGLVTTPIAVLQPAEPFLDSVGEDLRRRIFITQNENGENLCLRPEFTIPVCLQHIKNNAVTPRQYAYLGEVFRQQRLNDTGFYQAGIEDLGDPHEKHADARSLQMALNFMKRVALENSYHIIIGDQTVFAALLHALKIDNVWQKKLLRAFGNASKLHKMLSDFMSLKEEPPLAPHLETFVKKNDKNALIASLEEEMRDAGLSPLVSRNPAEIAQRLLDRDVLQSKPLSPKNLAIIQEFLQLRMCLHNAHEILLNFAQKHHLNLMDSLHSFVARNDAFQQAKIDLKSIEFDSAFGRPLDYYTGFVFEIRSNANVIVGGGRYDNLMAMLGAKKPIPAIGFSISLDHINLQSRSEAEGRKL
ncbi:ATP phosphoribosyltransferase regulatory subunit [Bartonella tamiae]|uniref:Class II Histidinyl-tRNA synthetase (HisRS)-like catalytic core domain-containing protein n=1 Tax=Bartonella tamiae Th239 TaxID=1094558 RepID=J0R3V6_9HYPH|nr:ATP phosphoribosyltransferase regulatory subunit [Bartonella tamiae]EJF90324.1 hypothetical protein ME5_00725 [Bartonella tamiae Th239]EJF93735.1 hypothetical protein MEG_01159 [Bartonella tamiae Th307]